MSYCSYRKYTSSDYKIIYSATCQAVKREPRGKFFLSAKGKAVICIYYGSWHMFSVCSWLGSTLLKFGQEICPLNRFGYGNSGGWRYIHVEKEILYIPTLTPAHSALNKQINECVEVQICLWKGWKVLVVVGTKPAKMLGMRVEAKGDINGWQEWVKKGGMPGKLLVKCKQRLN